MFIIKKKLEHHDEKRDYKMELQMNQKMEYKFQRRTELLLMKQKSIARFKFLILYDQNVIDKNKNKIGKNYFTTHESRNRVSSDLTQCENQHLNYFLKMQKC